MPNSCNRNHAESFFVKIFFCSTTIQALFKWPTINQQTELHDFSTTAAHNRNTQQQQHTTTDNNNNKQKKFNSRPSGNVSFKAIASQGRNGKKIFLRTFSLLALTTKWTKR